MCSFSPSSVENSGASSMTIPRTHSGAFPASHTVISPPEEWPETKTGSPITCRINCTKSRPMVLVTVSTTVCLYLGASDALKLRYPTDVTVIRSLDDGRPAASDTRAAVEQTVSGQGRTASDIREYTYLSFMARLSGNTLALTTDDASPGEYRMLVVLTAAEYGRLTGDTPDLSADEVLSYSSGRMLPVTFYLDQTAYHAA